MHFFEVSSIFLRGIICFLSFFLYTFFMRITLLLLLFLIYLTSCSSQGRVSTPSPDTSKKSVILALGDSLTA